MPTIKAIADRALGELLPEFDRMYSAVSQPSIPPKRQLQASLLIALYPVQSHRPSAKSGATIYCSVGFLDTDIIEPSFDPTVFTKSRQSALGGLAHNVGQSLFDEVVMDAYRCSLLVS